MLYLIVIEPIETRYTCEWYEHLPTLFARENIEVTVIEGEKRRFGTSTGAFLDFSATNIYKSQQVIQIAELFEKRAIKDGDQFLFLDAWHPGIINLKYMADLNQKKVKIHGIWHAGSYDPYDFLGYAIADKTWTRLTEKAYFEAIDYNYFATDFHIQMFCENLLEGESDKPIRTGFPFEYMADLFKPYRTKPKENIILFPHRKAKEKQLNLFLELKEELPQYDFVVCADTKLSKNEYRDLIGRSKLVFSANLQETLGISCYEILAAGGAILVPDRLSYTEMYTGEFVYPEVWTRNKARFRHHKLEVAEKVSHIMENFDSRLIQRAINENFEFNSETYFSATKMIEVIKDGGQKN